MQPYSVDKLMALTFAALSEGKDYTRFDGNELCERVVYCRQGQFLRRAAGFLVNTFTAKHV